MNYEKLSVSFTAGIKKCGIGGGIGLGVSLLYAFWNNRDKLTAIRTFNPA